MNKSDLKKSIKAKLFGGLGRTLTTSLLVFALVPMTLISVISYNKAHDSLEHEIQKGLENVAVLKTREIRAYFDNILAQLRFQSSTGENEKILKELSDAHEVSGMPLKDFVKSFKWAQIVENMGEDMKSLRRSFNYYDIFLIRQNGDIIFTVAGEADLGTNLYEGAYKSTRFAAACRISVETEKTVFSDYERYGPSGDRVYGFVTAPVINHEGERIGVMAFQFPIDPISQIMKSGLLLGKTAEIYLVGPDLTLRSGLARDEEKTLLGEKILTHQTRKMKQQLDDKIPVDEMVEEVSVYQGHHDKAVLGIHHDFQIEDVVFGLIAEIEEEEAFVTVMGLRLVMILMVGLTGFVVVIFAVILARQIVRPVIQLSSGTKRVAQGDFTRPIEIESLNEVGDLGRSFNVMLKALRDNKEELELYRDRLEQMVLDRTEKLDQTQKELVGKAIEAGWAQLSAMVLHNIGNAITPAKINTDSLKSKNAEQAISYLDKCYKDLKEHEDELQQYITRDGRGKDVFQYMGDLIVSLGDENSQKMQTVDKIESALSYVSEILSLQQAYSVKGQRTKEMINLNTLLEDAARMQFGALETRNITVEKDLAPQLPGLVIEKNRLMQVMVNFIKNGYEAIDELQGDGMNMQITLRSFSDNGYLGFEISDTGCGIENEEIEKVYEFGTSSKGSSGFGLHYCRVFVEANDGVLKLSSPGKGKGSTVLVKFKT